MSALLAINILVTFALAVYIIILRRRVMKIEEKSVDITPGEVITYVEHMREMLNESERVAEKLESSIREREEVLEDLIDITEAKLVRYENATNPMQSMDDIANNIDSESENDLHAKVLYYKQHGMTDAEITHRLGVSVTEVNILTKIIAAQKQRG